jgi:hypothetical protein
MNDTRHLLSTNENKKRLLESIAQDKKTSKGIEPSRKVKKADPRFPE